MTVLWAFTIYAFSGVVFVGFIALWVWWEDRDPWPWADEAIALTETDADVVEFPK